jgi:hypothetical protein
VWCLKYFDYDPVCGTFRKKTLFNENEILSSLSLPLRNEIVEQTHRKVVDGLQLFQSVSSAVRSALLNHLRPVLHVRGFCVAMLMVLQ